MENKWRFPGNNYTDDKGLDTSDMETFKKDAISSLAREVCQNSIDAKDININKPVKVEFSSFTINKNNIYGRDDIEKQLDACIETWKDNKKLSTQLAEMKNQIKKDEITCLRISDFNTTGLIGISGGENTPWHYLVHGSGLSDKSATSGGSKGIGKYATFVTSYFNTVFYSTKTINDEIGFEGICKLCSAKQEGTTEKTQGIGYFGSNDRNEPIMDEFILDPFFKRKQAGSDIYIIGFKEPDGWKRDIISKILDSFIVAIVYNSLEIVVDGTVINVNTLKDIVYNDEYINKKMKNSIISQYLLLTNKEHRYEDTIEIESYGKVKLYSMEFSDGNEEYATNSCIMVRYPYMKIKELNKISSLPCSALCIIENNDLNKVLRNIENPQHTDWEFNRIDDISVKNEIQGVYKNLYSQIKNYITGHLANSDETKTDLEGAGDYLPIIEKEDNPLGKKKKVKIKDEPTIRKKKVKAKNINLNASVESEEGNGVMIDILNNDENGEEPQFTPEGHNSGSGASTHPGDNETDGSNDQNGHVGVKHADLRGMTYRFYCKNRRTGEYGVIFISDFNEDDAHFELNSLDEAGSSDPVTIKSCTVNDAPVEIKDNRSISLSIKKGQKYNIQMVTDRDEMFSGEVKMYAYR